MKNGSNNELNIGLFGIGLDTYWDQFDGLLENLLKHIEFVATKLKSHDLNIINIGMIDSAEKALDAGHEFRRSDVDIIFIYATTYALSHTVLPVVQRAKVPVIILNLTPDKSIDYDSFNKLNDRTSMTGKWLEFCSACPVPEIANVFQRIGINFYQITGYLKEEYVWKEIEEWIEAAKVKKIMSHNRVGLMGHYYSGMLDIYTDITNQIAHFGNHFEILEVDELSMLRVQVTENEIDKRVALFYKTFDVQKDCSEVELKRSAKTSVALDKLVNKYNLGSMAYYYMGTGNKENEQTISSIILGNSLLTEKGVPVAGEYEIKNVQAMKIMDEFGAGGSFSELYSMDFDEDIIMFGHDGPAHFAIAEDKVKLVPLSVYHGKPGKGLSIQMSVKNGPVTLLAVVQDGNRKLKLLVAEGESVPGPIFEIGNTNSRYKFNMPAKEFMNKWCMAGPAHHCAIGIGHISSKLEKLAAIFDMEVIKI